MNNSKVSKLLKQVKEVKVVNNPDTEKASKSDTNLLKKYGIEKLKEFGYDGIIARLRNSGLIDK